MTTVRDLINLLSNLDPESEIMLPNYYYDALEGWNASNTEGLAKVFVSYDNKLFIDVSYVMTDQDGRPFQYIS